jgi:hypothetical protein
MLDRTEGEEEENSSSVGVDPLSDGHVFPTLTIPPSTHIQSIPDPDSLDREAATIEEGKVGDESRLFVLLVGREDEVARKNRRVSFLHTLYVGFESRITDPYPFCRSCTWRSASGSNWRPSGRRKDGRHVCTRTDTIG